MPFANSGDPNVAAKNDDFGEFPDGTYTMVGIEDYFTKDDLDYPTFKPINNELKCHCHFKVEELKEFPAWSGTANDYYRLAKALGANVEGLKVESTTHFLLEIEKRINAQPRSTSIYVGKKGWVKKINALLPPTGFYRVQFVKAFSLDGSDIISFQPETRTYKDGTRTNYTVRFQFKIVADQDGGTDYAGNTFIVNVFDPFDGVADNNPSWKHAKNGGMLKDQRRMMTFYNIFWPDAEQYRWVQDPEQSEFGIDEAANPIHVIVKNAEKSNRLAMTRIETNPQGFIKMDLTDLAPCQGAALTGAQPVSAPAATTSVSKAMSSLMAYINDEAYPSIQTAVFDPTSENPYALSGKGAEWCKKFVLPLWSELKFGERRNFSLLTDEQAEVLLKTLKAQFEPSTF